MRTPTGLSWLRPAMVVSLLLGAAGCAGSGAAEAGRVGTRAPAGPSTASSTGSTPAPTPVEQQVKAAVRAYYAELTRAARTNDVSKIKDLVLQRCPCYRSIRVIQANERQRERISGIAIKVTGLRVHDLIARSAAVEVRTHDAGYDVLDDTGEVVDHVRPVRTHVDLSLIRAPDNRWLIASVFDLKR